MMKLVPVALIGVALATIGCQSQTPRPPETAQASAQPTPPPGPPPAWGRPGMPPPRRPDAGGPWAPRGEDEARHHPGNGRGGPPPIARRAHGRPRGRSMDKGPGGGPDVMGELGMLGVNFHPPQQVIRRGRAIGLTPDQVSKIRDEMLATQKRAIDLRAKLEHSRVEIVRLLAADKVDERALNVQLDEAAKAQAEMHKLHIGSMLRVRALLTPEQRQKLDERKPQRPAGAKPGAGPVGQADGDDDGDDDDDDDETDG